MTRSRRQNFLVGHHPFMVLFYSRKLNRSVTVKWFPEALIAPGPIRAKVLLEIYGPETELRERDKPIVSLLYVPRGVQADDVNLF